MDRLIKTPFFTMVKVENFTPTNGVDELSESYKEFTLSVINLTKTITKVEIPAFFILTYARLELLQLQSEQGESIDKKKCANISVLEKSDCFN